MIAPALRDSRRLTGPNLISDSAGAIIDVTLGDHEPEHAIAIWREQARRILDAVGWPQEGLAVRIFPGGASLVMSAPIDALYAATEVNEWAWEATEATLGGRPEPALNEAAERLRHLIAAERNPPLTALRDAAREHGVSFLSDDDHTSVGMGVGSITWPVDSLPDPTEVPWDRVHDIPVALVTGSNGKTTTVRLLAAIFSAEGHNAGYSSTDGIVIGGELVDADDWSGPGGGRRVLRDERVEVAILETARGGILRRGLPVVKADAAIVTNVAADHLGEWGVHDVGAIADAKLVVARALANDGLLALNAEDPVLVERARAHKLRPTWFAVDANTETIAAHIRTGGNAYAVQNGDLVMHEAGERQAIAAVTDAPITMGGLARYNIENALSAIAVARALDIGLEPIRAGLMEFGGSPEENPGRGNFFELGGVRVLVDFAHNPHGMKALVKMAGELPAKRRLLILGQAGDRDDESIRELARAAAELRPDRIIIKELHKYLRGREEGEVPKIIEGELLRAGMPHASLTHIAREPDAVREALTWARPGDVLLFPVHSHRDDVLGLLTRLSEGGWEPGQPVD